MSRFIRFYLPLAFMLLAALACTSVSNPPDVSLIGTSIAQTIAATLTGVSVPPTATGSSLFPTLTFTPQAPTLSPTQTLIPTLPFTFTPLTPQIRVSTATNCRTGPGKVYPLVGGLQVGQVAEVYARDLSGNYWHIRNPDRPNQFCWLWGEYATLTGNIGALPMFTPPPTPTRTRAPTPTATFTLPPAPKFDAKFEKIEICKAQKKWFVEFSLQNTGAYPLRSITLTVLDVDKNITLTRILDGFDSRDGCAATAHRSILNPEKFATFGSQAFGYNPKGHQMRAWIVMCVKTGQGAPCAQKTLNFTP